MVGLYLGTTLGYAVLFFMVLWMLATTDWPAVVADARKRSEVPAKVVGDDEDEPSKLSEPLLRGDETA
jgi:hypothetical protein